jgi:hypothetical protein
MLTQVQGTTIANTPTIITPEQCELSVLSDTVQQLEISMRGQIQNHFEGLKT